MRGHFAEEKEVLEMNGTDPQRDFEIPDNRQVQMPCQCGHRLLLEYWHEHPIKVVMFDLEDPGSPITECPGCGISLQLTIATYEERANRGD